MNLLQFKKELNYIKHHKKALLEAYSQLYEIETTLRDHLLSFLPYFHNSNQHSYWQIVTLTLDYNFLKLTSEEKILLGYTTSIRNKVCHMYPITSKDKETLKKVLNALSN